jgi:hypothetical protein
MKPATADFANYADLGVSFPGSTTVTLALDMYAPPSSTGFPDGSLMGAYVDGDPGYGTYQGYDGYYGLPPRLQFSVVGNEDLHVELPGTGVFIGAAGTDKRLYHNGVLVGTASAESGQAVHGGTFRAWRVGTGGWKSDARIGAFAIWDVQISAGQAADFTTDLAVFTAEIGRS